MKNKNKNKNNESAKALEENNYTSINIPNDDINESAISLEENNHIINSLIDEIIEKVIAEEENNRNNDHIVNIPNSNENENENIGTPINEELQESKSPLEVFEKFSKDLKNNKKESREDLILKVVAAGSHILATTILVSTGNWIPEQIVTRLAPPLGIFLLPIIKNNKNFIDEKTFDGASNWARTFLLGLMTASYATQVHISHQNESLFKQYFGEVTKYFGAGILGQGLNTLLSLIDAISYDKENKTSLFNLDSYKKVNDAVKTASNIGTIGGWTAASVQAFSGGLTPNISKGVASIIATVPSIINQYNLSKIYGPKILEKCKNLKLKKYNENDVDVEKGEDNNLENMDNESKNLDSKAEVRANSGLPTVEVHNETETNIKPSTSGIVKKTKNNENENKLDKKNGNKTTAVTIENNENNEFNNEFEENSRL